MARPKKQTEIPGTERVAHADIDEAALEYRELRDRWQALGKEMSQAKDKLLGKMREHGEENYKFADDDGREVTVFIKAKENVHVRLAREDGSEVEVEDGEELAAH